MAAIPLDDVEVEDEEDVWRDAPRNVEGRAAQEAKWAGNYDGRQHWSLREAYRIYKDRLQVAQDDFLKVQLMLQGHCCRSSALYNLGAPVLERIADIAFCQGLTFRFLLGCCRFRLQPNPAIKITARKRPVLDFEEKAGDWDCVTVEEKNSCIICHDGRLDRTGRRLELSHKHFMLDRVYSESTSDDVFYQDSVQPLVRAVLSGRDATLICYGQTGTGKTHSFNACWRRIGADMVGQTISVTFFEIHGKRCYDLLEDRKEVVLRADAEDRVHVRGASTLTISPESAEDLAEHLGKALQLRCTEETERNPISSRSHAVCVLNVSGCGSLRMVDLAGSERNYETHYMTAKQHRDFVEINKSLMALKDCFREHAQLIRQKRGRPPYRASRLTQVLKSCFTCENHQTVIVAMLSPTATDLLHTSNSLHQVTQMSKELTRARAEIAVELPLFSFTASKPIWEWSADDVDIWIRALDGGYFKYLVLPPGTDGQMLLGLSSQGIAELFEQSMRTARGCNEGEAWNEAAGGEAGRRAGKMLFEAVRKEAIQWHHGAKRFEEAQEQGAQALQQQRRRLQQQLQL